MRKKFAIKRIWLEPPAYNLTCVKGSADGKGDTKSGIPQILPFFEKIPKKYWTNDWNRYIIIEY